MTVVIRSRSASSSRLQRIFRRRGDGRLGAEDRDAVGLDAGGNQQADYRGGHPGGLGKGMIQRQHHAVAGRGGLRQRRIIQRLSSAAATAAAGFASGHPRGVPQTSAATPSANSSRTEESAP